MAKPLYQDEADQGSLEPEEPSKWLTLGLPALGVAIVIVGGLLLASVVSGGNGHSPSGLTVHPIGVKSASSGPASTTPSGLPKPAYALPAGATVCPSGGSGPYDVVAISGATTCTFGTAVHDSYIAQPDATPRKVTDPSTQHWFTTRCTPGTPVVCTIVNNAQILLGAAAS